MYHKRLDFRTIAAAALGAVAVVWTAAPVTAADPVVKCHAGIAKALGKYEQARSKILQKCEDKVTAGKIAGPCPEAPKDTDKLAKALAKLDASVAKSCCGKDKTCGNADDVADPVELGWGGTFPIPGPSTKDVTCPNPNGSVVCDTITFTDPSDIAECIACNADANVDTLTANTYDAFADAMGDSDLIKCQTELGKGASKLYQTVSKELAKCRSKRLITGGGTCPGVKGIAKIDKAFDKVLAKINGKCAAFNIAEVGVPASCPTISTQGSGDNCTDAGIADFSEYLGCVTCVAESTTSCPDCGHCGDGDIDFALGETCDDGNIEDGDACPSDCQISTCTLAEDGETTLVDVSFTPPLGEEVAGLTIFMTYPEKAVRMIGTGNVGTGMGTPITNVAAGVDLTPNDRDYALQAVAIEGGLAAMTPGRLFTAELALCDGARVKDDDFVCTVVDAADPSLSPVAGVTCTAVQQ